MVQNVGKDARLTVMRIATTRKRLIYMMLLNKLIYFIIITLLLNDYSMTRLLSD